MFYLGNHLSLNYTIRTLFSKQNNIGSYTILRDLGAVGHAIQCALILTSEVDRCVSNIQKKFGHMF